MALAFGWWTKDSQTWKSLHRLRNNNKNIQVFAASKKAHQHFTMSGKILKRPKKKKRSRNKADLYKPKLSEDELSGNLSCVLSKLKLQKSGMYIVNNKSWRLFKSSIHDGVLVHLFTLTLNITYRFEWAAINGKCIFHQYKALWAHGKRALADQFVGFYLPTCI